MKHKLQTLATAVVLATMSVIGGIGCLMSGMLVEGNLMAVAVIAAATALLGGFCLQRRLSWLPGTLLGAVGLALWLLGPLNRSAEHLLHYISSLYHMGYGWGILRWSKDSLLDANSALALCYGASWLSLGVTCAVVKPKRGALGIGAVLLPMLLCLVLTDTVPSTGYLFLVLLCFALLLLTQTVRDQNPAQASRLASMLAAPLALALFLLFLLCPRDTYTGQAGAEKLEQVITGWFHVEVPENTFPKPPSKLSVAADVTATKVELTQVGPQEPGIQAVMQVRSEKTGTLYLRGSAYDRYDGTQWSISSDSWSRDGEFASSNGGKWTLTITTQGAHPVRYLTYAPADTYTLENGRVNNAAGATEYTVSYTIAQNYQNAWEQLSQQIPQDMQMYLELPDNTRAEAREYLRTSVGFPKEAMTAGDAYRYATTVSALVRNSARYDLNTSAMPGDAQDFALWFLKESDSGYCVHFASATAVLLRAAGIPTRYVSGYLVDARAGQTTNVRHKDAHAWVEYYLAGVGWLMLESTASGGDSPVTVETQPPETTGETQQAPTIRETEPTQETQAPTEPTLTPEQPKTGGGYWLLIAAVAVILAQWRLRVTLRRRRKGKAAAQALRLWQEVALCARLLKVRPDAKLHALAQKAKFSREGITSAELRQFEESLKNSRKQLKEKPIWNQLVYTLIFALY